MKEPIYLDYASTTPLDPEVFDAMLPHLCSLPPSSLQAKSYKLTATHFGNPGSLHSFGQKASAAVFAARQTVASALGAHYSEIVFTGSATEANNMALRSTVKQFLISNSQFLKGSKARLIVSSIEHESVLETARDLEREGVEVIYLPVSEEGIVDLKVLKESLNERTVLVSVMYGNNEVGTIQPIAEISRIIANYKLQIANRPSSSLNPKSYKLTANSFPLLHTDAVQAFQYLDCNVNELGVDLMTLSGHKIYGPKGIGALYVSEQQKVNSKQDASSPLSANSYKLKAILTGGGQEFGLRSGTENVPAIVGFAKAVELAVKNRQKEAKRVALLRDELLKRIKFIFEGVVVNGGKNISEKGRLPNNLNIYIPNGKGSPALSGEQLLVSLDLAGVAVSSGSACKARSIDPSHVLLAMGFDRLRAKNSIRFSLGKMTTRKEIALVANVLKSLKKSI